MRALTWSIGAAIFIAFPIYTYADHIEWMLLNWKTAHDFPTVHRLTPNELSSWLNDKGRTLPALLDVRTEAEFAVSHIHGAERVKPGAAATAIGLAKDRQIVTYCSVGYRSASFAKKLQDAGYTRVQNLSGSIFQWANEGHPIERDGQPAHEVHPYNRIWGNLLKPELRAKSLRI